MDAHERASVAYKCFGKKTSGGRAKNYTKTYRKYRKRKVNSSFINNIWDADLADMQLISKFNKGSRFLLSVLDVYSKYALQILMLFKKV